MKIQGVTFVDEIVISGTGLFTPPHVITNDELVESFNQYVDYVNQHHSDSVEPLAYSSSDFIIKASGIKSRYVIEKTGILDIRTMRPNIAKRNDDMHSVQCEMAMHAANEAFKNANISASDIDMVIVACSNMERAYPAVSIEIQQALGIRGYAFDLNVACSSATFAIQTGMNALIANNAKGVLIVNPEICSAHLNFRDRDCHFIFGDACTAVVLQRKKDATNSHPYSIVSTRLSTEFSNNIRNNFGFLNSCDAEKRHAADLLFKQQGRKVFKEVVPMVADLLMDHLSASDIDASSLKRLWLHQANLNMNQLIAKKVLNREPSPMESPSIIHEYANTSSAGSIIAFHKFHDDLKSGDIGVLSSFGAGYSVGSIILRMN